MVSEKKIFFRYKSMEANDPASRSPRGVASLESRGLIRRPLNIATYLICKLSVSWLQRRRFFKFSYVALYKNMTPWSVSSLEPRGLIGRIFVGDH